MRTSWGLFEASRGLRGLCEGWMKTSKNCLTASTTSLVGG